jgi:hypothetical protein
MAPRFKLWLIAVAVCTLSACSGSPSVSPTGSQISLGRQDLGAIDPSAPGIADGLLGRRVASSRSHEAGPMPRWQKVMARLAQQER